MGASHLSMLLKHKTKINKSNSAFTIVELSLVLIIVASLFSTGLITYKGLLLSDKSDLTKNKMEQAYLAIGSYLKVNHKLPCPASLQLPKRDANYGTVVGSDGDCSGTGIVTSSANTNLVYGMIPVKVLGLSNDFAEDGYSTKFSYVVDKRFTAAVDASGTTGFEGSDPNTAPMMEIREVSASNTPAIISNAILIIISHGTNKLGGFNAGGTTQNSTTGIVADETTNIRASDFDNIFVTSSSDTSFDDILIFKNKIELAIDSKFVNMLCREADSSYVVSVGSNFGTNKCYDDSGVAISLTWAKSNYGEISVPKNDGACPAGCQYNLDPTDYDNNASTYQPIRKCEKYGLWSRVIYPCFKTSIQ